MITRQNSWSRNALIALVISYLVVIPMALSLLTSDGSIDSDLRSLSPEYTKLKGLKAIVEESASIAERRIQFVLLSASETQIEEAFVEIEDALLGIEQLRESDFKLAANSYIDVVTRYPRNFLSDDDVKQLQILSDGQLVNQRLVSLYGVGAEPSFIQVQHDPLGVLSRYVLSVLDKLQPSISEASSDRVYVESLSFEIPKTLTMAEQKILVEQINAVQRNVERAYLDVEIFKSGVLFFAEEAASNSKKDISFIGSVSAIATIVLLLSIFRSLKPLVLPLVSILSGVFTATVVSMWIFGGIHILTIVFGASLVGVVVDYSLHYFYFRCSEATQHELSKVYKALFFSLLTSAIGYAALSLSGLDVLKQVAVFSVLGLSASWVAVVALGERLTQNKQTLHDSVLLRFVSSVLRIAAKPSLAVIACTVLVILLVAGFFSISRGTFLDNPRSFFAFSNERVVNENIVSSYVSSFEPASFLLVQGKDLDGLYANVARVRNVDDLKDNLFGLDDVLPSEQSQLRNFKLTERIYRSGLASSVLNRLGFDNNSLDAFVAPGLGDFNYVEPEKIWTDSELSIPKLWFEEDHTHYALFMIAKDADLKRIERAADQIDSVQFFSTVDNTEEALRELRQNATVLLVCACLFIYALVALRYRSFKKGVIVIIPVASITLSIAALHLLGGVNLFHIMALFLVLGLGMDYVIFVQEMSTHVNETMRAISLSCLTSLMAFGLLGLSSMPIVQSFGLAVLLGNTCNLIGTFVLAAKIGLLNDKQSVANV